MARVARKPDDARRAATVAEARALAHPDRLRIIRLTYDQELTNAELAARLGRDPASTLHHVRTLLDTGFLEALPVRRGARGSRERPYRSTGKSWAMDTDGTGIDINTAMLGAFQAEIAVAPGEPDLARLALSLSEEQLKELSDRLDALLKEAATWEPVEDGKRVAVFLAIYEREP
ncbi:MAG TPA: winged helix-turn-helix domain-containing protein [Mycobacteriales bacterium]|nr:winged helix-turn-helix domain-containing protein [Mycobacteriales bacterium]